MRVDKELLKIIEKTKEEQELSWREASREVAKQLKKVKVKKEPKF